MTIVVTFDDHRVQEPTAGAKQAEANEAGSRLSLEQLARRFE
jgi:hypothetical protein